MTKNDKSLGAQLVIAVFDCFPLTKKFRIGRHPALFMAVGLQTFVGIGISFAPNFPAYIVLRGILGIGNHMVLVLAFVMGTYKMEILNI